MDVSAVSSVPGSESSSRLGTAFTRSLSMKEAGPTSTGTAGTAGSGGGREWRHQL